MFPERLAARRGHPEEDKEVSSYHIDELHIIESARKVVLRRRQAGAQDVPEIDLIGGFDSVYLPCPIFLLFKYSQPSTHRLRRCAEPDV